ncbi:putative 1,4-beta-D-glucan cellobiohydrolase B [Glarea lozoyensis 74030]|uniref:Glucanase n=1 Tax=Glarea lozoyensis (strain ATCC 74030 / MF5533) TaxID=1104152 RepID=H0EEE5_GLAL7|nr:putative 1,4-beta-D-glucan cellobiohydrolase B [Glarea lozoyensis 74030]
MSYRLALALIPFAVTYAQQIGTLTPEVHPPLTWQTCTAPGSCTTVNGKIVLDSNWRWLHSSAGSTNCYTGNTWDKTLCPNDATCAANCALEGADYAKTYGITTSGNSLRLNFVTASAQKNVGSRVYLMADDDSYQMFNMLNKEFTFDVDTSNLPCGLNGALYMSAMSKDGGKAQYAGNKAGARYGCPRDLKFINGEMDIWEANSISTAYTPHPDDKVTQSRCTGDACGGTYSADRYAGTSDPDGCDFNSYRQGNKTFYGPGKTVDTNSVMTVVTQFLTNTGTESGTLSEIKRFYVQNGKVIPNSVSTIAGVPGNSITDSFCDSQKKVFGDSNGFKDHGGLANMGNAFVKGMVLVMSLWDDYAANALWLDSSYPVTADPAKPGVARGSCSTSSGVPAEVEANSPNAYVVYSNIKVGAINSTFSGTLVPGGGTPPVGGTTTSTKITTSAGTTTLKTSTTSTTSAKPTTTSSTGGTVAFLKGKIYLEFYHN